MAALCRYGLGAFCAVLLHQLARQVSPAFVQTAPKVTSTRLLQSSHPLAGHADIRPTAASNRPVVLPIFAAAACMASMLRVQVQRRAKGKPQTTSGVRVRKPKNNALSHLDAILGGVILVAKAVRCWTFAVSTTSCL
eukprot:g19530.t1